MRHAADRARQRRFLSEQPAQQEAHLFLVPQRIVDAGADVVSDVAHHGDERAVAVAHVLEQAKCPVLRAREQQLAVDRRERLERLRQQIRGEIDAQQACGRIAPAARAQHVAGIERHEDFVLELERQWPSTESE